MSYIRKTIDIYEIQSCYYGEWSTETVEYTRKDALAQLKCYRANINQPLRIIKKRELKQND